MQAQLDTGQTNGTWLSLCLCRYSAATTATPGDPLPEDPPIWHHSRRRCCRGPAESPRPGWGVAAPLLRRCCLPLLWCNAHVCDVDAADALRCKGFKLPVFELLMAGGSMCAGASAWRALVGHPRSREIRHGLPTCSPEACDGFNRESARSQCRTCSLRTCTLTCISVPGEEARRPRTYTATRWQSRSSPVSNHSQWSETSIMSTLSSTRGDACFGTDTGCEAARTPNCSLSTPVTCCRPQ